MGIYKKPVLTSSITNIVLSQVDRTYKGIDEWRAAIIAAESLYLPRRKLLYDLYDEITLDMHLTSLLEKRRNKVTNTTIKFFNKDGSENEEIEDLIETEAFEDMVKDILDSRFYGYSLLWFDGITKDKIDYTLIDRRHVRPDIKHVIARVYDEYGKCYTESPYDKYILSAGKPKDLGLLSKAAVGVIYKKGDVADWSVFAQVFGTPFREFIYEDPSTRKQMEQVALNSEAATYVVRPVNGDFKIHESSNKSGSSDLYKGLADFCDTQMSKLILLNTMTTDAQGGNYKGEVHAESEEEVDKADKRFILRILNEKFKYILSNFGFKTDGGWFAYEEQEEMTIKERLDFDIKFNEIAPLDTDYWYETYNRPRPKNVKKEQGTDTPVVEEPAKQTVKKDSNANKKELSFKPAKWIKNLFSHFPWAD